MVLGPSSTSGSPGSRPNSARIGMRRAANASNCSFESQTRLTFILSPELIKILQGGEWPPPFADPSGRVEQSFRRFVARLRKHARGWTESASETDGQGGAADA